MKAWRKKVLSRLDSTLIIFEFVLSLIFILVGYLLVNPYLRGVGVGLAIAWVTSAIAYFYKKNVKP